MQSTQGSAQPVSNMDENRTPSQAGTAQKAAQMLPASQTESQSTSVRINAVTSESNAVAQAKQPPATVQQTLPPGTISQDISSPQNLAGVQPNQTHAQVQMQHKPVQTVRPTLAVQQNPSNQLSQPQVTHQALQARGKVQTGQQVPSGAGQQQHSAQMKGTVQAGAPVQKQPLPLATGPPSQSMPLGKAGPQVRLTKDSLAPGSALKVRNCMVFLPVVSAHAAWSNAAENGSVATRAREYSTTTTAPERHAAIGIRSAYTNAR